MFLTTRVSNLTSTASSFRLQHVPAMQHVAEKEDRPATEAVLARMREKDVEFSQEISQEMHLNFMSTLHFSDIIYIIKRSVSRGPAKPKQLELILSISTRRNRISYSNPNPALGI